MNRNLLAFTFLSLSLAVTSCGTSAPNVPAATPAKSLALSLDADASGVPWTAGSGTVTVATLQPSNPLIPGDALATATVDASGTGTLVLPGSAGGIEAKATISPKAFLTGLTFECTASLSETNASALSVGVGSATFTSGTTTVALHESTPSAGAGPSTRFPLYTTQDDTVSGQVTCGGSIVIPVQLPLKRGWNVMQVVNEAAGNVSIGLDTSGKLNFVPN